MADYTTIRQDILNRITENGEGEITGLDLQGILLDMIDTTSVDINQMKQKLDDFFAASNLNDVIDNWTELESFLAGLTDTSTLVELLSYKADKVDVYTKTEADALFEFKANLKALAYKDSVSMGDISGLTEDLALKLDKSGGTITGDLGVDGILTMGTLRLPNASGVSGNFDLYVGSLGSGSDIPEGGGGTISYVAIKFVGENNPYEIDANGVISLPPYPDISHLATKVELTDGLATKQDVISDLATIRAGATAGAAAATPGYVDQKIADLVGSAPETLDTLQELAEALQNDAEVIDAINASIQQKANQSDLTALATRVGTAEGAITTLQGYFSNGVAKKATADADGNVITTTYYRKDGGTIGGNAYVQGELTMNTLFLPNSSNVPSAYSMYVGSLGSGSDVPSSGGDGDTVVFTPIDSNYGTLSINGTQVGALSINGHNHSQYQLQITTSNKLAYSLISGTPTSLPASDVYAWAKAATKPSYTTTEVAEGSNLYFTNARAVSALSSTLSGYLPLSGGVLSGNITLNNECSIYCADASGEARQALYMSSANNLQVGWGTSRLGHNTKVNGYNVHLCYGMNNTTGLLLNSSGNVGIGTTTDDSSRKLQVYQSSGWAGTFKTDKSSISFAYSEGQGISLNSKSNNVGNYLVNVVYGQTTLGTGGTTAFRINDNGNVLIGTTDDSGVSGKLLVNGGITLDGYMSTNLASKISDLNGKGLVVGTSATRGAWGMAIWTEGNGNGYIQQQAFTSTATTYPIVLQPFGGNVGIGTTDPTSKLQVNGNISASGYQLPTSAPSNPVSGGYYLYVGSLGAGATIS